MSDILSDYYRGTREVDRQTYTVLDAKKLYADYVQHAPAPNVEVASVDPFASKRQRATRQAMVVVWHPKEGDTITTSDGESQSAKGNEIVFIKKITDDNGQPDMKVYIPSDTKGPLTAETLALKYESEQDYAPKDRPTDVAMQAIPIDARNSAAVGFRVAKALPVPILHEVITRPTVIVGARNGVDQVMHPGDSLKFEDGECLPLPKKELDTAWKVSARSGAIEKA